MEESVIIERKEIQEAIRQLEAMKETPDQFTNIDIFKAIKYFVPEEDWGLFGDNSLTVIDLITMSAEERKRSVTKRFIRVRRM